MKTLLALTAFLVLAVPAALAVPPSGHGSDGKQNEHGKNQQGPNQNAGGSSTGSQLCKQQRHSLGMADLRQLYAPGGSPKAAMDACLAKQSQSSSTSAKNAAKACKAERESLGRQAFADKYGTNANKRNAFGKCVSKLASSKSNP